MAVVELVNVCALAERVVAGGLNAALRRLAADLGPAPEGPDAPARCVFLPPLLANLGSLPATTPERGLNAGVRDAARARPLRAGLVALTYPGASRHRRRWLVQHDAAHRSLREVVGGFARATGAWVVGPTALLDHPRVHWESWPDTGQIFHSATTFRPDGEPCEVARHPRPEWTLLAPARPDSFSGPQSGAFTHLPAAAAIRWDDDPASPPTDLPVIWSPRAWPTTDGPPSLGGRGASPDRRFGQPGQQLRVSPAAAVAVRSCLVGRLGARLVGSSVMAYRDGGAIALVETPTPAEGRALSWSRLRVELSS